MATAEASRQATNISKSKSKDKEKEKEWKFRSGQKSQSSSERLKTVVRRLPPNLPEEIFWQSVQKWVTDETATWKEYHRGKFRKRLNKENIPSRAYIAFKNEDALASFSREYDGHLFRDKAGNESIAIVEFAPYQKVPTGKGKADSRMATIDKDEDFISFLESLKDPQVKPFDADTLETLVANNQPPAQPTTTPLLEALKAEKSAQKDKEAILRNHAHYKDMTVSNLGAGSQAKKDDAKKKSAAASANAPQKASDAHPGKKNAKKAAAAAKAAAQPQAPPAGGAAQSKDVHAAASKQKGGAKVPKPPRDRQSSKGAASGIGSALAPPEANKATAATIPPAAAPTPAAVPTLATMALDAAPSDQPQAGASASRRGRPVVGLASRQFEAALSGAMGTKSKREREKDKDKGKDGDAAGTSGAKAAGPTSPRSRPKHAAVVIAPTILQREGQATQAQPANVIARPAGAEGSATPATREEGAATAGRGRGGRGRGRGGRGGRGS